MLSVPRTRTKANFSSQGGRSIDPPTCIVIGGTALAIDCVRRLREADYVVTAVLPTDEVFAQWTRCETLYRFENVDELSSWLLGEPADWLFSVVNPILLPSTLLASMRRGSFNYHDAPLPRYAGTHATSWALLALETEYAITCIVSIQPSMQATSLCNVRSRLRKPTPPFRSTLNAILPRAQPLMNCCQSSQRKAEFPILRISHKEIFRPNSPTERGRLPSVGETSAPAVCFGSRARLRRPIFQSARPA
jgi:hypothetical protein